MICHAGYSKQSHLTAFTFSLFETQPVCWQTRFNYSKFKNTFKYLQSCTACLGAVCLKTRLCAVYSVVCLAQCQRSDQQLLPPYTQRAADHTAHATKPIAVVMATGPLQPIKTPPLLSPLATAAAQELRERARHPILRRAMCFHFYPQLLVV